MLEFSQVKKNILKLLKGNIAVYFLGFINMFLLIKILGVDGFGIYTVIITVVVLINQIFNLQTWQVLIKNLNDKVNILSNIKSSMFIDYMTALVGFLFYLFVTPYIYNHFEISLQENMIFILAFFILFSSDGFLTGVLRFNNKFNVIVMNDILLTLSKTIFYISSFYINLTLDDILTFFVISKLFSHLYLWYYFSTSIKIDFSLFLQDLFLKGKLGELKSILSFSFFANLSTMTRMLSTHGITLIVGSFLGTTASGYYSFMVNVTKVFTLINNPVFQAIYPEYSKAINKNDINVVQNITKKLNVLFFLVSLGVIVMYLLFGKLLLQYFFNEFIHLYQVLLYYIIASCVGFYTLTIVPVLWSYNKPKKVLGLNILSSFIQIFVLVLLINFIGLYAVVVSLLFYNAIFYIYGIKLKKEVLNVAK